MISNIEKKILEKKPITKSSSKNNFRKMRYINILVECVRGELNGRYRTFM